MNPSDSNICISRALGLTSLVRDQAEGQRMEDNICDFIVQEVIMELLDRVVNIAMGSTTGHDSEYVK